MIVSSIQSRVFVRRGATVISGVIVLAVILLAIFGPFLAPHSPYQPVGLVYWAPDIFQSPICVGNS